MIRRCGEFIWGRAFRWCEEAVASCQFPVASRVGSTENRQLATASSYQGVGTLTFRVHAIYLGA
jgi:hypothetical protein